MAGTFEDRQKELEQWTKEQEKKKKNQTKSLPAKSNNTTSNNGNKNNGNKNGNSGFVGVKGNDDDISFKFVGGTLPKKTDEGNEINLVSNIVKNTVGGKSNNNNKYGISKEDEQFLVNRGIDLDNTKKMYDTLNNNSGLDIFNFNSLVQSEKEKAKKETYDREKSTRKEIATEWARRNITLGDADEVIKEVGLENVGRYVAMQNLSEDELNKYKKDSGSSTTSGGGAKVCKSKYDDSGNKVVAEKVLANQHDLNIQKQAEKDANELTDIAKLVVDNKFYLARVNQIPNEFKDNRDNFIFMKSEDKNYLIDTLIRFGSPEGGLENALEERKNMEGTGDQFFRGKTKRAGQIMSSFKYQKILNGRALSDEDEVKYMMMTDDEVKIYSALRGINDRKAERFLELLDPYLNMRYASINDKGVQITAKKDPTYANFVNIVESLPNSFDAIGETIKQNITKDENYNIDVYDPSFAYTRASSIIQNETEKNIESPITKFLYESGVSMGKNLVRAPLSLIPYVGKGISLASMGAEAAGSSVYEGTLRGLDSGEALFYGLAKGGVEIATEKIGLDNLLDNVLGGNKGFFKSIVSQTFSEMGEEFVSGCADVALETQFGKNSKWNQMVNEFENQGQSKKEAQKNALVETIKDIGVQALQGGFSGAVMGGTFGGFNSISNQLKYNNDINVTADMVMQKALEQNPNTTLTYEQASEIAKEQTKILKQSFKENDTINQFADRVNNSEFGFKVRIADDTETASNSTLYSDGYFDENTNEIVIPKSASVNDAFKQVLGHEMTHFLEQSGLYEEYKNSIYEVAKNKGVDIEAKIDENRNLYYNWYYNQVMEKVDTSGNLADSVVSQLQNDAVAYATEMANKVAESETVAKFTEEYLFADKQMANQIVNSNRGFAQKILQVITDLIRKFKNAFGGNNTELNLLINARNNFINALNDVDGVNAVDYGEVRYSVKDSNGNDIANSDDFVNWLNQENPSYTDASSVYEKIVNSLNDEAKSIFKKKYDRDILGKTIKMRDSIRNAKDFENYIDFVGFDKKYEAEGFLERIKKRIKSPNEIEKIKQMINEKYAKPIVENIQPTNNIKVEENQSTLPPKVEENPLPNNVVETPQASNVVDNTTEQTNNNITNASEFEQWFNANNQDIEKGKAMLDELENKLSANKYIPMEEALFDKFPQLFDDSENVEVENIPINNNNINNEENPVEVVVDDDENFDNVTNSYDGNNGNVNNNNNNNNNNDFDEVEKAKKEAIEQNGVMKDSKERGWEQAEKIDGVTKVRRAFTLFGKNTPDVVKKEIDNIIYLANDKEKNKDFTYHPISNDSVTAKAKTQLSLELKDHSFDEVFAGLEQKQKDGKLFTGVNTLVEQRKVILMLNIAKDLLENVELTETDKKKLVRQDIAMLGWLNRLSTNSGQILQTYAMIKKLTPEYQMALVKNEIEELNTQGRGRKFGLGVNFDGKTVTEDEFDKLPMEEKLEIVERIYGGSAEIEEAKAELGNYVDDDIDADEVNDEIEKTETEQFVDDVIENLNPDNDDFDGVVAENGKGGNGNATDNNKGGNGNGNGNGNENILPPKTDNNVVAEDGNTNGGNLPPKTEVAETNDNTNDTNPKGKLPPKTETTNTENTDDIDSTEATALPPNKKNNNKKKKNSELSEDEIARQKQERKNENTVNNLKRSIETINNKRAEIGEAPISIAEEKFDSLMKAENEDERLKIRGEIVEDIKAESKKFSEKYINQRENDKLVNRIKNRIDRLNSKRSEEKKITISDDIIEMLRNAKDENERNDTFELISQEIDEQRNKLTPEEIAQIEDEKARKEFEKAEKKRIKLEEIEKKRAEREKQRLEEQAKRKEQREQERIAKLEERQKERNLKSASSILDLIEDINSKRAELGEDDISIDDARIEELLNAENDEVRKTLRNELIQEVKTKGKTYSEAYYNRKENEKAIKKIQSRIDILNKKRTGKDIISVSDDMLTELQNAQNEEERNRIFDEISNDITNQIEEQRNTKREPGKSEKIIEKFKDRNRGIVIPEDLQEEFITAKTEEERRTVEQKILNAIANQSTATFTEKLNAWRYLCMLFSPKTHIRNIVGNTAMYEVSGLSNLLSAIGQLSVPQENRTRSVFGAKDVKQFAKEYYNENQEALNSSSEGKYFDLKALNTDVWKGRNPVTKLTSKVANTLVKANSWALEKEDILAMRMNFTRAFAEFVKAKGWDINDIKSDSAKLEQAVAFANEDAQKNTFRNKNELSTKLNEMSRRWANAKIGNSKGAFDYLGKKLGYVVIEANMPFKTTPINILARSVEYSPLEFINTTTQITKNLVKYFAEKNSKGINYDYTEASAIFDSGARALTGSAIFALGALMAKGLIPGIKLRLKEDDKDKNTIDSLRGEQDYSIEFEVGGNHFSYTLDFLSPVAVPLFFGVAYSNSFTKEEAENSKNLVQKLMGVADPIMAMSCLQSLNQNLQSFNNGSDNSSLGNFVTQSAMSYAQQIMPQFMSKIADTMDDKKRDLSNDKTTSIDSNAERLLYQMYNKIPILRQKMLPAKVDVFGNEVSNGSVFERIMKNFVSPGNFSKIKDDPFYVELETLYERTGDKSIIPDKPVNYRMVTDENGNEKKVMLNKEKYHDYQIKVGKAREAMLNDLVVKKDYKSMNDDEKIKAISTLNGFAKSRQDKKFFGGNDLYGDYAKMETLNKYRLATPTEYAIAKSKYSDLSEEYSDSNIKKFPIAYKSIVLGLSDDIPEERKYNLLKSTMMTNEALEVNAEYPISNGIFDVMYEMNKKYPNGYGNVDYVETLIPTYKSTYSYSPYKIGRKNYYVVENLKLEPTAKTYYSKLINDSYQLSIDSINFNGMSLEEIFDTLKDLKRSAYSQAQEKFYSNYKDYLLEKYEEQLENETDGADDFYSN